MEEVLPMESILGPDQNPEGFLPATAAVISVSSESLD